MHRDFNIFTENHNNAWDNNVYLLIAHTYFPITCSNAVFKIDILCMVNEIVHQEA